MTDLEKRITASYEEFAQIPSIKDGSVYTSGNVVGVNLTLSQRDIRRNATRNYIKSYFQNGSSGGFTASPFPTELQNMEAASISPSGAKMCVFRSSADKKELFIEIWNNFQMTHNIPTEGIHDKVYADEFFGYISWNRSEDRVLYIAEAKPKTSKQYWDSDDANKKKDSAVSDKDDVKKGSKYEYKEEWGEGFIGRSLPRLFVADLTAKTTAAVEGIPDNVAVGQAQFVPNNDRDSGAIFIGYRADSRKLGLRYCYQRTNTLYYIPMIRTSSTTASESESSAAAAAEVKAQPIIEPSDADWNVLFPRFAPNGKFITYFTTTKVPYHSTCLKLFLLDWETKERRVLVDIQRSCKAANDFPGLYLDILPRNCFTSDSKALFLESKWRSSRAILKIDIESGTVTRIIPKLSSTELQQRFSSYSLLDVAASDHILLIASSPTTPHAVLLNQIDCSSKDHSFVYNEWKIVEDVNALVHSSPAMSAELKEKMNRLDYRITQIPITDDEHRYRTSATESDSSLVETILICPPNRSENSQTPMIVIPHGGPHSVFPSDFTAAEAFFATQGFAVLKVNYRGSIGFGQESIEMLPGNIGTMDIQDTMAAVEHILGTEQWIDRQRLSICGGSHGGFITGHVIGQHPTAFKAAILRNPVIDMASMAHLTDIPDWCSTEIGYDPYSDASMSLLNAAAVQKLFSLSPIAHVDKVRTPALLLVGQLDRRVPPQQSTEYFHALRDRNVPTRLLTYPDNGHPIITPSCEADGWINALLWIHKHCSINNS